VRTPDLIRYADIDRQDHVNNAVYSTYFETGRVAIIHHPREGLQAEGATSVLARIEIDYLRELRWPGTVEIGTGVAICTQVNADGSLFDCQGSDVLPGGELREAGRFTIGKTWQLSILGGSGRYDGASGSVDGTWLDPQLTRSRDVFTIKTD